MIIKIKFTKDSKRTKDLGVTPWGFFLRQSFRTCRSVIESDVKKGIKLDFRACKCLQVRNTADYQNRLNDGKKLFLN